MCYTGFRISAYSSASDMVWDGGARTLTGGVKTAQSKGRVVPVPGFVARYAEEWDKSKRVSHQSLRDRFESVVARLGIGTAPTGEKHTPHDCRHTYSWLCDRCGVSDTGKHFLMGHALGKDVEKSVYTHRTLEELTDEVGKLRPPCDL